MKPWEEVEISLDYLLWADTAIRMNWAKNPGCVLGKYWSERMYEKIWKELREKKGLPYGFVGDGWPYDSDQSYAVNCDKRGFTNAFAKYRTNFRDAGDAIYQANHILDLLGRDDNLTIVDFGAGYGRLAIPFIYKYKGRLTYIGIDFSTFGLLISSQFLSQAIGANCRSWNEIGDIIYFDYISLPAWRIDEINGIKADIFVSVHSFQEMSEETVKFYVNFAHNHASEGAVLYSVNLLPENYEKTSWELLLNQPYPINRDGSFYEKCWKIC